MTDSDVLTFSIDSRVVDIFRASAIPTAFLSMYVMYKADHDRTSKTASSYVRSIRRLGFSVTSSILIYACVWFSIEALIALYATGTLNLAVSAVALYQRTPPRGGGGFTYRAIERRPGFGRVPIWRFISLWRKEHR